MGLRRRVARLIVGDAPVHAANEALARVEALEVAVRHLQHVVGGLTTTQLDEFDSIRNAVAQATDDLVARLHAIEARTARHG